MVRVVNSLAAATSSRTLHEAARGGVGFPRPSLHAGAEEEFGPRPGYLRGLDVDVVDVRFAIRHANDLRRRTIRRQLAGQPVSFEPAETFLLFDRPVAPLVGLAERLGIPIEVVDPHHAPHQFVRRHG